MKRTLYNLSMFAIAPLIGGIYAALFPVVATLLLWIMGVDALVRKLEEKGWAKDYSKLMHGTNR